MTHDPWTLHASLSCPACQVTGKVVQNEAEAYDEFEAPFVCCDCGQAWRDAGMMGDDSLKECRVNMMRLVEGRPYEPPKPKEPAPTKLDATLKAFDSVLKDYYRPAQVYSSVALPNGDTLMAHFVGGNVVNASITYRSDDIPVTASVLDCTGEKPVALVTATYRDGTTYTWNTETGLVKTSFRSEWIKASDWTAFLSDDGGE